MDSRNSNTIAGFLGGLVLLGILSDLASPAMVYVTPEAKGAGDGTSWANASVLLADALLVPGTVETRVAAGTCAPASAGGDRNVTFRFGAGQTLHGGFRGNETARSQRDPATNPKIITGELDGDDLPGFGNATESSRATARNPSMWMTLALSTSRMPSSTSLFSSAGPASSRAFPRMRHGPDRRFVQLRSLRDVSVDPSSREARRPALPCRAAGRRRRPPPSRFGEPALRGAPPGRPNTRRR